MLILIFVLVYLGMLLGEIPGWEPSDSMLRTAIK